MMLRSVGNSYIHTLWRMPCHLTAPRKVACAEREATAFSREARHALVLSLGSRDGRLERAAIGKPWQRSGGDDLRYVRVKMINTKSLLISNWYVYQKYGH